MHGKIANNNTHLSYHHVACPDNISPCQVQSALLIVTPIVVGLKMIQSTVRCKVLSFFWDLRGANSLHCVTTLCFAFGLIFFWLEVHNHEALATFQTHMHIHSKTSRWISC